MKRRRTKHALPPLPESPPELLRVQQQMSAKAMRSHDDLPAKRREAATLINVDVGNDRWARVALSVDDGRYLLGGRELLEIIRTV